jgi:hypothetical protein
MEHQHLKNRDNKIYHQPHQQKLCQAGISDHTYRHSFKNEMKVTINIKVPRPQKDK